MALLLVDYVPGLSIFCVKNTSGHYGIEYFRIEPIEGGGSKLYIMTLGVFAQYRRRGVGKHPSI